MSSPNAITARRAEIFKARHLPTLRAFPGAHELLARFKQDGLKLVIATSSGEEQLNDMLEQTGLDELVERKTSSSDAGHSKPSRTSSRQRSSGCGSTPARC